MTDLKTFSYETNNICKNVESALQKLQEAGAELQLQITETEAVWGGTSGEAMLSLLLTAKAKIDAQAAVVSALLQSMRIKRAAAIEAWPEETEGV